ncbi:MAG: hypothetical protein E7174_01390 [Firmicutes bacterium]|nr:hypothetical protein [Bacillota bacterium]
MKKKNLLIGIIISLVVFCYASPVLAANIASCESSMPRAIIDEKIPNMVSTVITVIKVVVPVLIVVLGMIDLVKGMTASKEDEMKKGQKMFIKRLVAGALVFFVFTIVQLLISFVADEDDKANIATCSSCFINGDCTYKFKDEASKTCPDGMTINGNGTACLK